jgi:hypothetical protein
MNKNTALLISEQIEIKSVIGSVYTYEEFVKGVVDIELGTLALGGEFHVDSEAVLLENGSSSDNTWGFNIYFEDKTIIYTSMINIKPKFGYKTNIISDPEIIEKMDKVINKYIL